ncbi:MAG: hypothetical protein OXR73_34750, partial [Myxococcales bacterium]|nr:hypothetical protein [Myxococcales bacterium]
MLEPIWHVLKQHKDAIGAAVGVLGLLGGGFAWVYTQNKTPTTSIHPSISAGGGVAAGGNIHVLGDLTTGVS